MGQLGAIICGYIVGLRRARRAQRNIGSIDNGAVADSFALMSRIAAVVGAALGFLLYRKFVFSAELIAFAIMSGMCIEQTLTDAYTHRLVRSTTRRAAIFGGLLLTLSAFNREEVGIIVVMATSFIAVLVIFKLLSRISRGGIGGGDVRLAPVLAMFLAYLGSQYVVLGLALGFILGGLVAAALLITRRASRSTQIAFGPYLCFGALAMVVSGQAMARFVGV